MSILSVLNYVEMEAKYVWQVVQVIEKEMLAPKRRAFFFCLLAGIFLNAFGRKRQCGGIQLNGKGEPDAQTARFLQTQMNQNCVFWFTAKS